jgi:hypothetical protein
MQYFNLLIDTADPVDIKAPVTQRKLPITFFPKSEYNLPEATCMTKKEGLSFETNRVVPKSSNDAIVRVIPALHHSLTYPTPWGNSRSYSAIAPGVQPLDSFLFSSIRRWRSVQFLSHLSLRQVYK